MPTQEAQAPADLLPVAEPPLDREGLLLAVNRAGSDFAARVDDAARQRELDARPFEVRLRFGCPGDRLDTRQWSFEERSGVLRVRVEPELSAEEPTIAALGLEPFEAVEGFWIHQPWLLRPACPARRGSQESDNGQEVQQASGENGAEAARPAPRIGIAHFFTAQDSRTRRRDNRAYETTVKLAEDEQPSADGYDLVLSGRLARLPDGRVIACAGDAVTAPPRCIVSADFDRVMLTRPDGQVLAEWSSG